MPDCPRCGKEIRAGEPLCAYCGFILPSSVGRVIPKAVPQSQEPQVEEPYEEEDTHYATVDKLEEEISKVSRVPVSPVRPKESHLDISYEKRAAFQPIKNWSQLVQVVFILLLVCTIVSTWSELSQNGLTAAAILQFLLVIASGVLFLMWVYRANRNLASLTERNPQFSPGWSVGWFFVPYMNFFRPYQVVAEIWRTSYPKTEAIEGTGFTAGIPSPIIVRCWWAFYLISNFIGYIVLRASLLSYAISSPVFPTYVSVASGIIDVIGILITIFMVRQISQFQERKHELINRLDINGYRSRY